MMSVDYDSTTNYEPVDLSGGRVPTTVQQERAARAQKKRNDTLTASGKNTMFLPGGAIVDVTEHMDFRYDFKQNHWIGDPRPILKDPKPRATGYDYGWPRRVDAKGKSIPATEAAIRQGKYRPISPDEVDEHTAAAIFTHKGVNGDLVCWGDLMLVEIRPDMKVEQYDNPQKIALTRLSNYEDILRDDVEQISKGKARVTEFGPDEESHITGVTTGK